MGHLRFAPAPSAYQLGGVLSERRPRATLTASGRTVHPSLGKQFTDPRSYGTICVIGNSLWREEIPMLETHM